MPLTRKYLTLSTWPFDGNLLTHAVFESSEHCRSIVSHTLLTYRTLLLRLELRITCTQ